MSGDKQRALEVKALNESQKNELLALQLSQVNATVGT